MVLLIGGDWRAALATHAFAPVFLLGCCLMAGVSLLPEQLRRTAIDWFETLERRTGVTAFLLLGLVAYWGLRLTHLL